MLRVFEGAGGAMRRLDDGDDIARAVWIDMLNPDQAEEARVEQALGHEVPTREEMAEIEASSRLYAEGDTLFMTALLPAGADGDAPEMGPVTFILADHRLVTLRYHQPRPFADFPARAERGHADCATGERVLLGLLETIVDRLADVLERAGAEIEALSRRVFAEGPGAEAKDYKSVLAAIGRKGDFLSNIRNSLMTLTRLLVFLGPSLIDRKTDRDLRPRHKMLMRDAQSLNDHAGYLTQKITFLLDATLGMINTEQSEIIKIFSVVAAAFLPPTLIASIYGMNFEVMPELEWTLGYPWAILLMVISGVAPVVYFRRRGWL